MNKCKNVEDHRHKEEFNQFLTVQSSETLDGSPSARVNTSAVCSSDSTDSRSHRKSVMKCYFSRKPTRSSISIVSHLSWLVFNVGGSPTKNPK